MTIDIEKLRQLAEKATPGPWRWADWNAQFGTMEDANNMLRLERNITHGDDAAPHVRKRQEGAYEVLPSLCEPATDGIVAHNAAFIAAANPAAVLALLDELARLTACLVKANGQTEHFERQWYLVSDGLDDAKQDITAKDARIARLTTLAEEACAIAERRGAAIDYIERKVDGYETVFDCADEIEHGLVDVRGSARIEGAVSASNNADRIAAIRAELGREM